MATIVQIGAGAIGRGFLGQLWSEGGYETVFVDVSEMLVDELNQRGSYPLRLVTSDTDEFREIAPVRAIRANDTNAVVEALASCSFAATSVGARHIENVARKLITPALLHREQPLNVLLCENGLAIRENFLAGIDATNTDIHAVETVIGRMVPGAGINEVDPLTVVAEPFHELPFNRSQWYGNTPSIPGLVPVVGEQFYAYELRKLFFHNGGHALLAYHGYRHGYSYIHECVKDAGLVAELSGFWTEVCNAFRRSEYRQTPIFSGSRLESFTSDLLHRFINPHLGDTVLRVARDPLRKLTANERLVGAAVFCDKYSVEPIHSSRAIAAAFRFDPSDDPGATILQQSLAEKGVRATIAQYTGIEMDSPLTALIEKEFTEQGQK